MGNRKTLLLLRQQIDLYGRVVKLSRDIVAGNTPPTIAVDEEWWDKDELPVPTEAVADHEVAKLRPQEASIPKASPGASTISLARACIAPLTLAHPLLKAPYLSPAAAYSLLAAKVHSEKWDVLLKPLMTWLRASLYAARPGVTSLPPLELADHITVGRQNMQKAMVPSNPSSPAAPAPTYIIKSQPALQAAPAKKKEPAERWDLLATYLYRLADVQGPDDLPNIWKTLAPLSKEKARPAFKMACRESERALRCKAPRVTHAVAVVLLGLHFHT